jgi:hypothetical protein
MDGCRIDPPSIHWPQEQHRVPEPFIRVCRYPDQARFYIDPSYSCNVRGGGGGGGAGLSLQEGSASNPQPTILVKTYWIPYYPSIHSLSTLWMPLLRAYPKPHSRKYKKIKAPGTHLISVGSSWTLWRRGKALTPAGNRTLISRFPVRSLDAIPNEQKTQK